MESRTYEYSLDEAISRASNPVGTVLSDPVSRAEKLSTMVKTRDHRWTYGVDMPTAVKMLGEGWLDFEEKFSATAGQYYTDAEKAVIDWQFSDNGEEVDVCRYLGGEQECFLNPVLEIQSGTNRVVELEVNLTVQCSIPAQCIENRGAAIYALMRAIEASGRAVGLTVVTTQAIQQNGSGCVTTRVRVKDPNDYINPSRAAFALAHPAAFRKIFFRIWEQFDTDVQENIGVPHRGYGTIMDSPEPRGIYFPVIKLDQVELFSDVASTRAWANDIAKTIGVTIQ